MPTTVPCLWFGPEGGVMTVESTVDYPDRERPYCRSPVVGSPA